MSFRAITWIHISDLHFCASRFDTWDQDIVLDSLLGDLRKQISERSIQPDLILVSGDIAFAGQPTEYKLAQGFFDDLLQTVGLPKTRLFVVPGNHDVNRNAISRGAKAIARNIVDNKLKSDLQQAAREVLCTDEDRALVFNRLETYGEFVNEYLSGHIPYSDAQPFYVYRLEEKNVDMAILGLNSAWLCCGGDEDRHRILLSEYQVREALKLASDADLRIAVVHHPFDWLHDLDRDAVALLLEGCDFVLHGHLHHLEITQLVTPDSDAIVLVTGACYEEREKTNAYNLVQLNLEGHVGNVIMRRYSDERGGFWANDTLSYRNVENGEFTFVLPDEFCGIIGEDFRAQDYVTALSSWPEFRASPNVRHLMLVRIEFIEAQLYDITTTLASSEQGHPIIGKFLSSVNYLVRKDIDQLKELFQLDSDIEKLRIMLCSIEEELARLSEEYLDYQAGLVLRNQGEGKDLCEWSDALLTEIGVRTGKGWQGTSVLANKAVVGTNSHLVRIPFPGEDIWGIPFAVYQYASLMDVTQRVALLMGFVEPNDRILPMLAADMLATYLLGPAYAFAAVLTWTGKMSPLMQQARGQGNLRGLSNLRISCIVQVLRSQGELYTPEVERLNEIWQTRHVDHGNDASQKQEDWKRYLEYLDELYKQVVLLKYGAAVDHLKRKSNAKRIAQSYESNSAAGEVDLARVDLADILNAAWYSRMLYEQPKVVMMKRFYRDLFRRKVMGI